jgi:hypothetical protein
MIRISIALIGIIYLSSCATILTGTRDRVNFRSNVEGATVSKDGNTLCKTPCSVKIKRKLNGADIEVSKEGYETKMLSLETSFNAVSVINLFSLFGWGIDLISGAVVHYDPRTYNIELSKTKTTAGY